VPTLDIARVQKFGRLVSKTSTRLIYLVLDQERDPSPVVYAKGGAPLPRNPLKDVRVRRAMSLAIDRNAIVQRVMSGEATAAGQIAAPGMFGHDDSLPVAPYDPDQARRLLKEAGWGDGFELALIGPGDRYVNDEQILQAIASMWSRIGITVKVEAMPFASLSTRIRQRNFAVYLSGLAASTREASSMLRPLVMSFDAAKGTGTINNGRYSNPKVDEAVEQSMATLLDPQRQRFIQDAVRLSMQEVALIPLHWQKTLWATSKKVHYAGRADEYTLAHEIVPGEQ